MHKQVHWLHRHEVVTPLLTLEEEEESWDHQRYGSDPEPWEDSQETFDQLRSRGDIYSEQWMSGNGNPSPRHVFIFERVCKIYLDTLDAREATETKNLSDLAINPNLPKSQRDDYRRLLDKYEDLFDSKTAGIFPASIKLSLDQKPGATPSACPCPNWTPSIRTFLTKWAHNMLDTGRWKMATDKCQWASRILLIPKHEASGKLRGIRTTCDLREVNERTQLPVPGLPRPDDFRQKFTMFRFLNQIDLNDGFSHVRIDPEGDTANMLAAWTPLGLMTPNFMSQGVSQAPGCFQRAMSKVYGSIVGYGTCVGGIFGRRF